MLLLRTWTGNSFQSLGAAYEYERCPHVTKFACGTLSKYLVEEQSVPVGMYGCSISRIYSRASPFITFYRSIFLLDSVADWQPMQSPHDWHDMVVFLGTGYKAGHTILHVLQSIYEKLGHITANYNCPVWIK